MEQKDSASSGPCRPGRMSHSAMEAAHSLDVDAVMKELTLQEKISLLSGTDNWHLFPVERLGIPAIRVSDGPNGVRGTRMFNGTPAACLPCGTALAATWDVELVRRGGALQAAEAIAKGVSVVLGPTMNTQRSPLGGRGFESFSEDPVLAGAMAAATVAGLQEHGVAATIKHFVCNDQEHERMSQDVRVSERALREIYALPFQIALRDARPWALMTSYNRVNGTHASENQYLLRDILRGEWGFDGLVMSDWTGTYSTAEAIKAGLDLEMPGPAFMRGAQVNHALMCGKLSVDDIDVCVRRVLQFINRVMPLGIPSYAPEKTIDNEETSARLRELASASIVLLKNDGKLLPFRKDKTIAVIGPNAKFAAYSGGGSASLRPYYAVTPFDAISAQAESTVEYTIGYGGYNKLPLLSNTISTIQMRVYAQPPSDKSRTHIDEIGITDTNIYLFDYDPPLSTSHKGAWYATFTGDMRPDITGLYEFSLSVAGTARLYVDGELLVDAATRQVSGGSFYGFGTTEVTASRTLEQGRTYTVTVEFGSLATSLLPGPGADSTRGGGIRMGCARVMDPEEEIRKAVDIAGKVDQVVILTGLNSDWESEGYDRASLDLPAHADELIARVVAANRRTAVVVQSGTPVGMPWAGAAAAVLQAWYGGCEAGRGVADVLFGAADPAGRLPLTLPRRLAATPAFLAFGAERCGGRTRYAEDVHVGYRWYERTGAPVLFPFGHGLSYAEFALARLRVDVSPSPHDYGGDAGGGGGLTEARLLVSVGVSNRGSRAGSEVVQVYVSQRGPSAARPIKELKGFSKVKLGVGEERTVEIPMSLKYACSFWDEQKRAWVMERGTFDVLVGTSSADESMLTASFDVPKTTWWNGL